MTPPRNGPRIRFEVRHPSKRGILTQVLHVIRDGLSEDRGTLLLRPDEVDALRRLLEGQEAKCHDCERPYGDEHGFPDLVVPSDVWARISPTGNAGGLLCPSCICKRLHDFRINCEATFTSGPLCGRSEDAALDAAEPAAVEEREDG